MGAGTFSFFFPHLSATMLSRSHTGEILNIVSLHIQSQSKPGLYVVCK